MSQNVNQVYQENPATDLQPTDLFYFGRWPYIPGTSDFAIQWSLILSTILYAVGNDVFLPLAGGTMTGPINMGNDEINNLADPVSLHDAATKNYVDSNFLQSANNLSDLKSASTARTNLGLGTAAVKSASGSGSTVSSVSGVITAGHIATFLDTSGTVQDGGATSQFLETANNLSDLSSASTARTNLGLGSSATHATTDFLQTANNLSDIPSASTARTNLGLGSASTQSTSTFSQVANNLSDLSSASTSRTNLGLGTAAVKTASGAGSTVASVSGVITAGHITTFADTNGTVQDGGATSQFLLASNNLSDVASASTARTNLGLGTAATHASTDFLSSSGGTMAGAINMGSHQINSVTDPTNPQDAATKNYVDTIASGLQPKEAVAASTTANLVGTYSNGVAGVGATFTMTATGVLALDGQNVVSGSRYLLKNQSSGFQNGVYDCTVAGAIGVATVFTRSANYNTAANMNAGDLIPVIAGTLNANTAWLQSATITTVGTDNLVFTQFGSVSPLTTKGDIYGYDTAGNRIPVGGNYKVPMADSTVSLGISYQQPIPAAQLITYSHMDFTAGPSGDSTVSFGFSGTGAVCAIDNTVGTILTNLGIVRHACGTTNAGYAFLAPENNNSRRSLYLGGATIIYETCIYLTALSNGTDRYIINLGPMTVTGAVNPANGVWIAYSDNVNSGNWTINAQKASGGVQTTNAASGPSTSTWYKVRLVITDATSVQAYVGIAGSDLTSIGTLTTALPVIGMYPYSNTIVKTAGTTNVEMWTDYCEYKYIYDSVR